MLAYLRLLRAHHWTKNAFCLAGVLFSGRFTHADAIVAALLTFLSFCAASSSVYILNDLLDRKRDRNHPKKRHRPLAIGTASVVPAVLLAIILAVGGLVGAFGVGNKVVACLILYLINNAAYSVSLKHLVLFDVMGIAFGFVLRMLAGVYAVGDLPTTWITLCTFFLAVFLGSTKRLAELAELFDEEDKARRPVLSKYTAEFLDYLVSSAAIMTVICYALFTTSSGKNASLVITVPIVFFAVMHYKQLVFISPCGQEPEQILLKDPRIQAGIVVWFVTYFMTTHGGLELFR
jgi:4-hydroxybenzoate polyprenyltransferase